MATLTLTNPTLANPATSTDVDANFSDIVDFINGASLDTGNLSPTAAMVNSQFAASDYEFLVNFHLRSTDLTHSTTTPSFVIGLPTLTGDAGNYTIENGSWFCSDVGDQTEDFTLTWGYFVTGTWTLVGSAIATVQNLLGTDGANTEGQGTFTIDNGSLTAHASNMYGIGINFPNAMATGFLSSANDYLSVSLKIFHAAGLRALP